MYYSAIGLLAAVILLIENKDVLWQDTGGAFDKPAWKVYRKFLFAVLAYYITDILWGVLESRKLTLLLFADTTVYYAAMAAGVLFWAQFTVSYLEERSDSGRLLVYAGRIVGGLIILLTVVNIFTPVLFLLEEGCVYRALPLRYVTLVIQILLLLLISAYAFSRRYLHPAADSLKPSGPGRGVPGQNTGEKRTSLTRENRLRALSLFGLFMALFLFIQLWFPFLPLYTIAYLLGTCLIHTFVVSEEEEEYRIRLDDAEKVKELKNTISSLLDNMPAMAFVKDARTGEYLTCNQAFAVYANRESPEGVIGLTSGQIFDAVTAKRAAEEDMMALSMDEPYVFFQDVMDASGVSRQLQTTKLKYFDSDGRLCVLGMCQDVTDMVRIQREDAKTKEDYEKTRSTGILYSHISQALARGYTDLYYVNIDSEEYIKYRNDDEGTLTEEGRGWHFFEKCRIEAENSVIPEYRASVKKALDRKNLVSILEQNRVFVTTFRMTRENGPRYISLKVSRMQDDDRWIIFGMIDIDDHMKERSAAVREREEQNAYARLTALNGEYQYIYIVDPESGSYRELSSSGEYEAFEQDKEGGDFIKTTREAARRYCHPADLNRFLSTFTRENVMEEIGRSGIFMLTYRIMAKGVPLYVQLKAALIEEKEGTRMIVGISDIDAQVRQEEEYIKTLSRARIDASIDPLTGVKNRNAWLEAVERLNDQILERSGAEFAIVILDVNDLKKVNDTQGHSAGDKLLQNACGVIKGIFEHSYIYRIGGDEFAVIAQGKDYSVIEALIEKMSAHNKNALRSKDVVIACGMAKFDDDSSLAPVFDRADQSMYLNKSSLKVAGKRLEMNEKQKKHPAGNRGK